MDYMTAAGLIAEHLALCCDAAQETGLEIDLEPVNHHEINFHNTVAEVVGFVEEVGKPNLKILIDTYHMHLEEKSIEQAIIEARGLIGHVHLADSNRLIPSRGDFDFEKFFDALAEIGYRGTFSVETLSEMNETNIIQASEFLNNAQP